MKAKTVALLPAGLEGRGLERYFQEFKILILSVYAAAAGGKCVKIYTWKYTCGTASGKYKEVKKIRTRTNIKLEGSRNVVKYGV